MRTGEHDFIFKTEFLLHMTHVLRAGREFASGDESSRLRAAGRDLPSFQAHEVAGMFPKPRIPRPLVTPELFLACTALGRAVS